MEAKRSTGTGRVPAQSNGRLDRVGDLRRQYGGGPLPSQLLRS
jgi:hypothetical protein